jgi:hypothetical protein
LSFETPTCQDMSLGAEELNWGTEASELRVCGDGSRMIEKGLDCEKKPSCVLQLQWNGYKSTARVRLVKTENTSVCIMVNCKMCSSATALISSWVYKMSINPTQNLSIVTTPKCDNTMYDPRTLKTQTVPS